MISCGGGGESGSSPATATSHISVSHTQIDFGDVVWDNISDRTITIRNTGPSSLNIGQIAQANPLQPPFSIFNDNCSSRSLSASQTCTLQVRFAPTDQGSGLTDALDIPSNASNQNPVIFSVSGNGRALRVFVNQVTYACPDIDLSITVTDRNGAYIPGLTASNFQLTENYVLKPAAVSPMPVTEFVSVALALDNSNSMTNQNISDMQSAAQQFIDQLNLNDEASIIKFSTEIVLSQSFTTDKVVLKNAIDTRYGGDVFETHLYDAIWSAVEETALRTNNRAVIVLTDGKDEDITTRNNGSVRTLSEVIALSIEKNVPIFTIGLGDIVETGVLSQIANETGGQYFYTPDSIQLANIYQRIKNILSGKYLVTYPSTPGSSNTLHVLVDDSGKKGVVTRQIDGCP
jgi:VWFA-related protein